MLDTSGLPTLDLQIPIANEYPSAISVTPGAFADGSALITLQNSEQHLSRPPPMHAPPQQCLHLQ